VHLLRFGVAALVRTGESMQNDEEIVVVFLDFRPLIEVKAVLERQVVKRESFPRSFISASPCSLMSIQRVWPRGGGAMWSGESDTTGGLPG